MTAAVLRQKYPTMPQEQIDRLLEIEQSSVPTLEPQLCRIDDPSCESCQ